MNSHHGVNSNPPKQSSLKSDIEEIVEGLYRWTVAAVDPTILGTGEAKPLKPSETTQALLNKIENIGIEIIGDDEPDEVVKIIDEGSKIVKVNPKNQLRATQRTKLKQIIGGRNEI